MASLKGLHFAILPSSVLGRAGLLGGLLGETMRFFLLHPHFYRLTICERIDLKPTLQFSGG